MLYNIAHLKELSIVHLYVLLDLSTTLIDSLRKGRKSFADDSGKINIRRRLSSFS